MNLLTTVAAAERTGRHRNTIRKWVARGWLKPVYERGNQKLYEAADVDAAQRQSIETPVKPGRAPRKKETGK